MHHSRRICRSNENARRLRSGDWRGKYDLRKALTAIHPFIQDAQPRAFRADLGVPGVIPNRKTVAQFEYLMTSNRNRNSETALDAGADGFALAIIIDPTETVIYGSAFDPSSS